MRKIKERKKERYHQSQEPFALPYHSASATRLTDLPKLPCSDGGMW